MKEKNVWKVAFLIHTQNLHTSIVFSHFFTDEEVHIPRMTFPHQIRWEVVNYNIFFAEEKKSFEIISIKGCFIGIFLFFSANDLNFGAVYYIIDNFSWCFQIQILAGTIYPLHFPYRILALYHKMKEGFFPSEKKKLLFSMRDTFHHILWYNLDICWHVFSSKWVDKKCGWCV